MLLREINEKSFVDKILPYTKKKRYEELHFVITPSGKVDEEFYEWQPHMEVTETYAKQIIKKMNDAEKNKLVKYLKVKNNFYEDGDEEPDEYGWLDQDSAINIMNYAGWAIFSVFVNPDAKRISGGIQGDKRRVKQSTVKAIMKSKKELDSILDDWDIDIRIDWNA
tara:strand:- start:144 stop:641 length:498 start_codon:yes stop_codon:yes gene_type:complete